MGLLSNGPVLIRVVAVEVPAPDCLDSPRCANQRLEIPAILAGHLLRRFQQFFNPPQNDIFSFVEDVIPFSNQFHRPLTSFHVDDLSWFFLPPALRDTHNISFINMFSWDDCDDAILKSAVSDNPLFSGCALTQT